MKKRKKWYRSLGTSKRDQDVTTPPSPNHPKRRAAYFAIHDRIVIKSMPITVKKLPFWLKLWRRVVRLFKQYTIFCILT